MTQLFVYIRNHVLKHDNKDWQFHARLNILPIHSRKAGKSGIDLGRWTTDWTTGLCSIIISLYSMSIRLNSETSNFKFDIKIRQPKVYFSLESLIISLTKREN